MTILRTPRIPFLAALLLGCILTALMAGKSAALEYTDFNEDCEAETLILEQKRLFNETQKILSVRLVGIYCDFFKQWYRDQFIISHYGFENPTPIEKVPVIDGPVSFEDALFYFCAARYKDEPTTYKDALSDTCAKIATLSMISMLFENYSTYQAFNDIRVKRFNRNGGILGKSTDEQGYKYLFLHFFTLLHTRTLCVDELCDPNRDIFSRIISTREELAAMIRHVQEAIEDDPTYPAHELRDIIVNDIFPRIDFSLTDNQQIDFGSLVVSEIGYKDQFALSMQYLCEALFFLQPGDGFRNIELAAERGHLQQCIDAFNQG